MCIGKVLISLSSNYSLRDKLVGGLAGHGLNAVNKLDGNDERIDVRKAFRPTPTLFLPVLTGIVRSVNDYSVQLAVETEQDPRESPWQKELDFSQMPEPARFFADLNGTERRFIHTPLSGFGLASREVTTINSLGLARTRPVWEEVVTVDLSAQ